jgi:hypothetical protein
MEKLTNKKLLNYAADKNSLTRAVVNIIIEHDYLSDYDGDFEHFVSQLLQHGCVSGMIGSLIYFSDTVKFYEENKSEIAALLYDTLQSYGSGNPAYVFGYKWETYDPLALEDSNQNLLAWFGFEETVRRIADDFGIEI